MKMCSLGQKNSIVNQKLCDGLAYTILYLPEEMIGFIYEFPAQLPPLARSEVGMCLSEFTVGTAAALKELHGIICVTIPQLFCYSYYQWIIHVCVPWISLVLYQAFSHQCLSLALHGKFKPG